MFTSIALLLLTSSLSLSVLGSPVQFRVDRSNHIFFPVTPSTNSLTLRVKTLGVTEIVLSSDMELVGPHYEITLGLQESGVIWSKISKNGADKVKVETPFILNGLDFTSFKILWDDAGHIAVGRDQDSFLLILWKDADISELRPEIRYYGIRTRQLNTLNREYENRMHPLQYSGHDHRYTRLVYHRPSYYYPSLDTNVNEESDWELEGTETVNFVEALITNFLPSVGVSVVSVSKPYESETTEPATGIETETASTSETETESPTETETESPTETETESPTETETESPTETETESPTETETESPTETETESPTETETESPTETETESPTETETKSPTETETESPTETETESATDTVTETTSEDTTNFRTEPDLTAELSTLPSEPTFTLITDDSETTDSSKQPEHELQGFSQSSSINPPEDDDSNNTPIPTSSVTSSQIPISSPTESDDVNDIKVLPDYYVEDDEEVRED